MHTVNMFSRLGYYNDVFTGLFKRSIRQLQLNQNVLITSCSNYKGILFV